MKINFRTLFHELVALLIVLLFSAGLLFVAASPTNIHSREILAAHARYLKDPTEENRKAFQETADRVNRPFHTLQALSLLWGIGLPVIYALRLRKTLSAPGTGVIVAPLIQTKFKAWLLAVLLATFPTVIGWLAFRSYTTAGARDWLMIVGIVIQFPAIVLEGIFALVAMRDEYELNVFLTWMPLLTWIFYLFLFYWTLSRQRSTRR